MFSGRTFAAPGFIQYGKDYQANTADNAGSHVYATKRGVLEQLFTAVSRRADIDLPPFTVAKRQFTSAGWRRRTNPAN
jgi:hypothetical protein